MSNELLNLCPRWDESCIRENCVSYEVHTKQRFYNLKTQKYIPIDQIHYYSNLPQEELNETIRRTATISRECKFYGKVIQIEEVTDHKVPSED